MEKKNVINIINFVRGNDHRETPEELLDTFRRQVEMCADYGMPCTFLMQYDAFVKPEYAELLTDADEKTEVGVWIEMAKPLVEKCGIKWNGRPGLEWDWYVNPDMLSAYTKPQREKLIDELMEKFREVFGYYPKSAGSWIIDSYSMEYMQKKYGIKAFCICREQFGTDGYTLWGGYYNQGYFPSKKNMLIPAQTKEQQINAPVFRMLGIDPMHQYDMALDENYNCPEIQALVATMEPTCGVGKNEKWVDWYLNSNFEQESMSFAYTQIGQENSFTWKNFGEALLMQMDKVQAGYKAGKWSVMTLEATGEWFSSRYSVTPATSITALKDFGGGSDQTVWYDCRNYRANMHIKNGCPVLRDIFLFDESYTDRYYDIPATGNSADFDALPLIDGCRWGGDGINSVLRFVKKGTNEGASGSIIASEALNDDTLRVTLQICGEKVYCIFNEEKISIEFSGEKYDLLFSYKNLKETAITEITSSSVVYGHNSMTYGIKASCGIKAEQNGYRITPDKNSLEIGFIR